MRRTDKWKYKVIQTNGPQDKQSNKQKKNSTFLAAICVLDFEVENFLASFPEMFISRERKWLLPPEIFMANLIFMEKK